MIKTKVTQRGQTVVPAEIRRQFGIGDDSSLLWDSDGKTITVIPAPADPIGSMRGYSRGHNLRKALIRSRKEDEN